VVVALIAQTATGGIQTITEGQPAPQATPTEEPTRKDIALGLSDINGRSALFYFHRKLNQELNPQNIYVYTSDEWYKEGLSDTDYPTPFKGDTTKLRRKPVIYISILKALMIPTTMLRVKASQVTSVTDVLQPTNSI